MASALAPNTSAATMRAASPAETQASHGIAIAQATMPSPAVRAWINSSVGEYGGAADAMAARVAGQDPARFQLAAHGLAAVGEFARGQLDLAGQHALEILRRDQLAVLPATA